jgi:hypothetical protein
MESGESSTERLRLEHMFSGYGIQVDDDGCGTRMVLYVGVVG